MTDPLVAAVREAGAAEEFIAVMMTDAPDGGRHHVRSKVRVETDVSGALPGPWGHFMTALWEGRHGDAWARADVSNRQLMRAAGVAPCGCGKGCERCYARD